MPRQIVPAIGSQFTGSQIWGAVAEPMLRNYN
jgi:hypothetical protein